MPYTLQYGQCGDPGKYIHLTPNYILSNDIVQSFGPKGKTIVHEWAHLRWGVYDESATEGYDEFYYDTNGKLEATRCPVSLNGENIAIDWKTGEMKPCQMDQHTNWVPGANCTFIPYENQDPMLSSSMMSHQYIDQIFTFCHDDPNDPVNQHNKKAPNEHNRLCNQRSVWDVIMSSADFENGVNSPNSNIASTAPTFKFVQPQVNKFVLVLDISGSMNGKNSKICYL
uniref:Calcium-activated chloride channel N-terminal domain-containing protein n=1 Tax=Ciona savignyi TaxID=51511 RepID=H2ZKL7_CIOSA